MANKNEDINIIYSSILREKHTFLSEYTECSGNFSQIIEHIMKEVVNKFENPPDKYRTYFFYGKYAIFLIKYNKIYILIMFPNTKINNNEILFALLYSIFEKLKNKKGFDLNAVSKMRAYTLKDFSVVLKEQIKSFNSNRQSFISYLSYSNEFTSYKPFEDNNLEVDIQLPILSNLQVHADKKKKNDEEIEKESIEISSGKSYNSMITVDSFNQDILKQDKSEKLVDDNNLYVNNNVNAEENNFKFKEKNRDQTKCKRMILIISIIIIFVILAGILFYLYY